MPKRSGRHWRAFNDKVASRRKNPPLLALPAELKLRVVSLLPTRWVPELRQVCSDLRNLVDKQEIVIAHNITQAEIARLQRGIESFVWPPDAENDICQHFLDCIRMFTRRRWYSSDETRSQRSAETWMAHLYAEHCQAQNRSTDEMSASEVELLQDWTRVAHETMLLIL